MDQVDFEKWRSTLLSLDRYESQSDAKAFVQLARDVESRLDGPAIDVLLETFCDDDDYGIQESVLTVLDKADAVLFAERLARKFPDLLRNASAQEWPLLLVGRTVNSNDPAKIAPIVEAAKKAPGALNEFIHSQAFLDEYPEIEAHFKP